MEYFYMEYRRLGHSRKALWIHRHTGLVGALAFGVRMNWKFEQLCLAFSDFPQNNLTPQPKPQEPNAELYKVLIITNWSSSLHIFQAHRKGFGLRV